MNVQKIKKTEHDDGLLEGFQQRGNLNEIEKDGQFDTDRKAMATGILVECHVQAAFPNCQTKERNPLASQACQDLQRFDHRLLMGVPCLVEFCLCFRKVDKHN